MFLERRFVENVPRKHSAYESAKAADALGDERPNADALGVERPNEMLSSAKAADALRERLNADADTISFGYRSASTDPLASLPQGRPGSQACSSTISFGYRVLGDIQVVVAEPPLEQRSSSGKAADVLGETICGKRTSQTFCVRER